MSTLISIVITGYASKSSHAYHILNIICIAWQERHDVCKIAISACNYNLNNVAVRYLICPIGISIVFQKTCRRPDPVRRLWGKSTVSECRLTARASRRVRAILTSAMACPSNESPARPCSHSLCLPPWSPDGARSHSEHCVATFCGRLLQVIFKNNDVQLCYLIDWCVVSLFYSKHWIVYVQFWHKQ